jgi:hypothetical protein
MVLVLRWHAFAFLGLLIFFIWSRYQIALAARKRELAMPAELDQPPGIETSQVAR